MRRVPSVSGVMLACAAGLVCIPCQATEGPQTIAVIDFLNNSLTDRATYDPLSQGLSAALATELSRMEGLEIVERSRIRQVVAELGLQASGAVDDRTAGQIGRILGARYLLLGSYMVMGKKVRVDVRLVETETTRLVKAEQVTGKTGDLLDLIGRLAGTFSSQLGKKLPRSSQGSMSEVAFSHFSMGVRLEDSGDLEMARREYAEALEVEPDFGVAAEAISRVETRIRTESRVRIVSVTGRHSLAGGLDAARESALDDALRRAVIGSTRRVMGGDSLAFHHTVVQDGIFSRSRGYVREYQVTGQRDSSGTLIVTVDAQVARGVLEDDLIALGVLHPAWAHPRVMVVVEEDAAGAEYAVPGGGREPTHTEMQLQGVLTERGFRVIDVTQFRRTLAVRDRGLSPPDLTAYALTQGGDLIVMGRVTLSGGGAIGSYGLDNLRSSTAEGNFQILRADNGQVIGTVNGRGVGADPHAVQSGLVAIQTMCGEVGPRLAEDLIRLAREEVYGQRIVSLHVRGVRSQADLEIIERILRERIEGVLTVIQRSREREEASFEVSFEGHTSELAREINRVSFGSLTVIVEESSLGMIRARIDR